MTKRLIKTGDYVEVLPGGGVAGVKDGEQGFVISADRGQDYIQVIFPANGYPFWAEDNRSGWLSAASELKLLYRPSPSTDN